MGKAVSCPFGQGRGKVFWCPKKSPIAPKKGVLPPKKCFHQTDTRHQTHMLYQTLRIPVVRPPPPSSSARQMTRVIDASVTRVGHPRRSPASVTRVGHPRRSPVSVTRVGHPRRSPVSVTRVGHPVTFGDGARMVASETPYLLVMDICKNLHPRNPLSSSVRPSVRPCAIIPRPVFSMMESR